MGIFYKPSSYRNIRRCIKKTGDFSIENSAKHCKATHKNGAVIMFPRSTSITNGTTQNIAKKLLELGYSEEFIKDILS